MKTKTHRAPVVKKKKLLELSSAKLSALSVGLLLAVFCTIGMSFRPVYDEQEAADIVLSGPRRSHWTTTSGSGCDQSTDYHNTTDYGKAVAVVAEGQGTVSVSYELVESGNDKATIDNDHTSLGPSTTRAQVTWSSATTGSGSTQFSNDALAASHSLKVTFTATPADGWGIVGWSTSATENDKSKGTNDSFTEKLVIGNRGAGFGSYSGSSEKTDYNSYDKADETIYYVYFVKLEPKEITMAAAEEGSYSYSCEDGSGTVTTANKSVTTKKPITFTTGTPASGYKFYGWCTLDNDNQEIFFSYDNTVTKTFTEATTVYAKFIKTDAALFEIKGGNGTTYYDLNAACEVAKTSSSKVVVPTANGTLYNYGKDYTIPSGVTLLVPFDDAYTLRTTDPTHTYAVPGTPSLYRKLILGSNVQIIVNGSISVSSTSQGNIPYGGCVYGKYGQIDMQSGSTITLNNGANLYCWGYITGSGEITAKSGSKVYEDFQIACWRGGNAASNMNSNSKKVFPLAQYYIQNIEAKLHLQAGASEYVWTSVSALSAAQKPNSAIPLVGASSGLFQISSGTLTKWFNATDDRQMYEMNGDMALGSISMKVYITISSADYVLPLTNNMDITVKSGTMTCNQKIALLPGAKITIQEGANVSFGANSELYVYDKDEWPNDGASAFNYNNVSFKKVNYTATKITNARTYANMNDAIMDINGTFTTASGNFYTTSGKANIYSSNGTGKVIFQAAPASKTPAAGSKTYTYQATQSGSTISYTSIPITPAKLHNSEAFKNQYGAEFEYLATAGTAANTTITYADGHWGWVGIWKDEEGNIIKVANTCLDTQLEAQAPEPPAKADEGCYVYLFEKWVDTRDDDKQQIIYTASYKEQIKTYTISYASDEYGTGTIESVTKTCGEDIMLSSEPFTSTRNAYIQTGWSTSKGGAKAYALGETYAEEADLTLYPVWELPEELIVTDDAPVAITQDGTTRKTTVRVKGQLSVPEGNSLTTDDLFLEATPTTSGNITGAGTIRATRAYFKYAQDGGFKARTWYSVAVPWQVDASSEGTYTQPCGIAAKKGKGAFTPLVLGKQIDLIYYKGQERADHGHSDACWQYVEDDGANEVMLPGKAYMFFLAQDADTLLFERKDGAPLHTGELEVYAFPEKTGRGDKDANWNGIANPATYKAYLNAGTEVGFVYNSEDDTYTLIDLDKEEGKLVVGQAIYVQVPGNKTVVANPNTFEEGIALAPRRTAAPSYASRYDVYIGTGENRTDRVIVRTEEGKEDRYVIAKDLVKFSVGDKVAQIWVNRYDDKLTMNTMDYTANTVLYPLGVYVPEAGEYIIANSSMTDGPEGEKEQLYLTINGRVVWNLSYAPYAAELGQGTTSIYGLKLVRSYAPAVSTDIQQTDARTAPAAEKIIIDNKVFILRGSELYSPTGQKAQ